MYANLAIIAEGSNKLEEAIRYSDSAVQLARSNKYPIPSILLLSRSDLFKKAGRTDSALTAMQQAFESYQDEQKKKTEERIVGLTLAYQSQKQNDIILEQKRINQIERQRLVATVITAIILGILLVVLFILYRRIRAKNNLIELKTSELENSIKQKETLLNEIHHRLKNNLQMVVSFLDIQKVASETKSQHEIIAECKNRILSMGYLHSHLYENENYTEIQLNDYLNSIASLIGQSYQKLPVNVHIQAHSIVLDIEKSLLVGLILVELLSNSYKYAFTPANINPTIEIRMIHQDDTLTFSYSDNGDGLTEDQLNGKNGTGLQLVRGFSKQLNGNSIFKNDHGMHFSLTFKS